MSQARPRAGAVTAALLITAAAAAALRIGALGLYDDDWAWFAIMARAPDASWLGIAAHFARTNAGLWARPLNYLFLPGFFKLFGAAPLPYHLMFAALTAWGADALRRWLEEDGVSRETAALAAVLFILWPNHDATRHWICIYSAPAALALTLESLRLRRGRPALAAFALLAGGLLYESAAPLALLPLFVESWRERRRGALAALKSGLAAGLPLLAGLAVLVLWQRVLCPLWLHPERHPMSLWPGHAFRVFWTGLECQALNRLWHLLARQAAWAYAHFDAADWLAWAAASTGLAFLSRRMLARRPSADDAPPIAIALFVLGYAPYVLDAGYVPVIFSPTNRVNFVSSTGAALFAAWGLRRLAAFPGARARAAAALCVVMPAAMLLATWASNAQWARAASLQREILSALTPRLDALPPGRKTLLLHGFESFVGSAPVFNSTYDLDGALSLTRRDADLQALVGEGRMRFEDGRAVMSWFAQTPLSYEGLYAYRHDTGRFSRIANRAAGDAFLSGR